MTRAEGQELAHMVRAGLPSAMMAKLKSIWIMPHLHNGHLTIRIFMYPQIAEDPEPFVFASDEI